jgi:hypothetical protein
VLQQRHYEPPPIVADFILRRQTSKTGRKWIRLVPSGCGGDDFIGVSLPSERLWVSVVVCEVSIDGSLQIDDADKGAAFEAPFGQHGEEAFNRSAMRRWSA